MIEHSLGISSASASNPGNPPPSSLEKNNSGDPLKIPLKSSAGLPMNPPEAMKGAL
jgi:hypothetical protein